jgi:hypothetical protein
MSDARETYAELFKLANGHVKQAVDWKKLLPWLVGGGALAAGVPVAYAAGRGAGEEEAQKHKALTFGAGALSGLVAPHILKQLRSATGLGIGPGMGYEPEFTEF